MANRTETEAAARRWIEGYLKAWRSNEPDDIRALFAPDAEYRTDPWVPPLTGHDAIVRGWLERKDEPGVDTFTFAWDIAGIDGDLAFVEAETRYTGGRAYSNLWVLRLQGERASSFTEWWMDQADPS